MPGQINTCLCNDSSGTQCLPSWSTALHMWVMQGESKKLSVLEVYKNQDWEPMCYTICYHTEELQNTPVNVVPILKLIICRIFMPVETLWQILYEVLLATSFQKLNSGLHCTMFPPPAVFVNQQIMSCIHFSSHFHFQFFSLISLSPPLTTLILWSWSIKLTEAPWSPIWDRPCLAAGVIGSTVYYSCSWLVRDELRYEKFAWEMCVCPSI